MVHPVRGRAPETWGWLAVISDLVETFGNYRVVQQLSNRATTVRWHRFGWLFVSEVAHLRPGTGWQ